jgi:hypothetical protein
MLASYIVATSSFRTPYTFLYYCREKKNLSVDDIIVFSMISYNIILYIISLFSHLKKRLLFLFQ